MRRRLLSAVWAFVFTFGMLWLIDRVTPVKLTQRARTGLDREELGEEAYTAGL